MTQQTEEKEKTTGTIQSTPVHDEQSKTTPAEGELRDEELEKASGGGRTGRPVQRNYVGEPIEF